MQQITNAFKKSLLTLLGLLLLCSPKYIYAAELPSSPLDTGRELNKSVVPTDRTDRVEIAVHKGIAAEEEEEEEKKSEELDAPPGTDKKSSGELDTLFWKLVEKGSLPDPNPEKPVVLVLGNTRVGKSTVINYLMGHEMMRREIDNGAFKFAVEVSNEDRESGPSIGHEDESHTEQCTAYHGEDFIYIDTPGLSDTRGKAAEAYNRLIIHRFIQESGELKAVLVVEEMAELKKNRGAKFEEVMKVFGKYGLGKESLNVFWVVNQLFYKMPKENLHKFLRKKVRFSKKPVKEKVEQLLKEGRVLPIHPLDHVDHEGKDKEDISKKDDDKSREALLNALNSLSDHILYDREGVGKDIEKLAIRLFKEHPIVHQRICIDFFDELEYLEEDISILIEDIESTGDTNERVHECVSSLVQKKKEELEEVSAKIAGYGELEESGCYAIVNVSSSVEGLTSSTLKVHYKGVPFAQEKSKFFEDGCTSKEVVCKPEEGEWSADFETPVSRVAVVGAVGVGGAGAVGGVAVGGVKGVAVAIGGAAGAGTAIVKGAEARKLVEKHIFGKTYAPQLKVWCNSKELHSAVVDELKKKEDKLKKRVEELEEGREVEDIKQRVGRNYDGLDKKIQEMEKGGTPSALQFIGKNFPTFSKEQTKLFPFIGEHVKNYEKYKQFALPGRHLEAIPSLKEVAAHYHRVEPGSFWQKIAILPLFPQPEDAPQTKTIKEEEPEIRSHRSSEEFQEEKQSNTIHKKRNLS